MTPKDTAEYSTSTISAKPTATQPNQIKRIVTWSVGAPVFVGWMLFSALPAFNLLMPDHTALSKIIEVAFLATSFFGLFGLYIAARSVAIDGNARSAVDATLRSKGPLLLGYAALWLAVYGHYQWLFV